MLTLCTSLSAEPVEEVLVIDEELTMTTKVPSADGHPIDTLYSGWHYRTPETRALEADSFSNPGMLGVEQGEEIWNTVEGSEGKSCATCHDDAAVSMKGVGANYPKWDADGNRPINVEGRINKCRVENMGAEPYKFDKGGQKPLTAYIKHQSTCKPGGIRGKRRTT